MYDTVYCCIDLKSFYASVECVERGLDPFKANLIVADPDRKDGTICLAISPAMKNLGIKNRCRLYEIPKNVDYIVAKPRMKLYMEKSAQIFSIYLRYISADDIHVYSVDECFIDLTDYVKIYDMTPEEICAMLLYEVKKETGICATVGIGTNLFLAKVALDITAKHAKNFTAFLDETLFKLKIWHHRPITDVWNIGRGTAKRLEKHGLYDLYDVAHADEDILYKEFGINAELLIDHSKGIEPCTIKDIHEYNTKHTSFSNSQILFSDYSFSDAFTILKEMVEQNVLELVEKDLVCDSVSLSIGYSDRTIKHTGASQKLGEFTNSHKKIFKHFKDIYFSTTLKDTGIRKITVGLNNTVLNTFLNYNFLDDYRELKKENILYKTVANIKGKYGKNALLKGVSYQKEGTARERNKLIGGHNGGEED